MIVCERMCDVCKKEPATRKFKVKESHRKPWTQWSPYKQIDICSHCAEKLLELIPTEINPTVESIKKSIKENTKEMK